MPECANFLAANKTALKEQVEDEANSPTLDLLLSALAKTPDYTFCRIADDGKHRLSQTDTRVANRSYLVNEDGAIIARYDKIHMFDADVGDGKELSESDHFRPGQQMVDIQTSKGHFWPVNLL